jgi:hypothetical protein
MRRADFFVLGRRWNLRRSLARIRDALQGKHTRRDSDATRNLHEVLLHDIRPLKK